jgi:hypothetical protein
MESVVLFRSYSLLGPAINIAIFGSKGWGVICPKLLKPVPSH